MKRAALGLALVSVLVSSAMPGATADAPSSRWGPALAGSTSLEGLRRLGTHPSILRMFERAAEREEFVFQGWYGETVALGDLDRDGRDDVLAITVDYEVRFDTGPQDALFLLAGFEQEVRSTVTALSGRTGETLWTKVADDWVNAFPARVGGGAGAGVMLIHGAPSLQGPVEQHRLVIDGIAGNTGKRVWRRSYETTMAQRGVVAVAHDAPMMIGVFDALRGPGTEVVVGLSDVVQAAAFAMTTTTLVVNGQTGEESVHPARDVGVNWFVAPWAMGDIDRDGLDDYVVIASPAVALGDNQQDPSAGPIMYARTGKDGAEIWAHGGYDFEQIGWAFDIGDVDSDRRGDIGVSTLESAASGAFRTDIVNGAGGEVTGDAPGLWPFSPGDVDGDGRADVITRRIEADLFDGRIHYDTWAVNGRGKRLFYERNSLRYPPASCAAACSMTASTYLFEIGDAQPDGLIDSAVTHSVEQEPGPEVEFAQSVDSSSGAELISGEELHLLDRAVDGKGSDAVRISIGPVSLAVEAIAGTSGAGVWRTSTDPRAVWTPLNTASSASAADLDGDRKAEVLVSLVDRKDAMVFAFSGVDGELLWARGVGGDRG